MHIDQRDGAADRTPASHLRGKHDYTLLDPGTAGPFSLQPSRTTTLTGAGPQSEQMPRKARGTSPRPMPTPPPASHRTTSPPVRLAAHLILGGI